MKNKLLLFLLFHLLIGNKLTARNFENNGNSNELGFKLSTILFSSDTIKKNKKTSRIARSSAVLLSPTVVAGSSCGDGVAFVQANLYANGQM